MYLQKQLFRGVLSKRCSENMQQTFRRTPMPKCDFNTRRVRLMCTQKKPHFLSFKAFLGRNIYLSIIG